MRVWGVDGDKVEVLHFEGDDASFKVVVGDADAIADRKGSVASENRSARVAFLFGVVPVGGVAVESDVELSFLEFGLLETEKIGVKVAKNVG